MQPLPPRASQDIFGIMKQSNYSDQSLQLWLSFFEIYGGKVYDLLNERRYFLKFMVEKFMIFLMKEGIF
jgi:kinesin family protein 2/24